MKFKITRRYLAGLFDGEGYVSIKPEYKKGRTKFSPMLKMALTEKSAFLLFAIRDMFGGHIYKRTYSQGRNWNDSYYWDVHNFGIAEKVLDYIRPYLILKKEQADLVYRLIKTKVKQPNDKITDNILQKRRNLYTLVKKLNKRGRLPAETKRETPTGNAEGEVIVRTSGQPEEGYRKVASIDEIALSNTN